MQAASSQLLLTGVSTRRLGTPPPNSANQASRAVPTLTQYAVTWLESIEGIVLGRTREAYRSRLELHVMPRFGECRLDQVGVDEVLALISDMRKRGYSGATISAVLIPLSRPFAHAVRRDVIQVRQSELLGLHWRDIDFDNQVIHVRGALDREQQEVPPKTENALRDVILMPALAKLLRQHQRESRFHQPDNYVFTTRVGTPHQWANLSARGLQPALKKAGIQPLRWHDLRHTFASLLIAGGANITFTSRQLGHSSSQITLGVYAHLLDREEQAQRTRDMLQDMLGSAVE